MAVDWDTFGAYVGKGTWIKFTVLLVGTGRTIEEFIVERLEFGENVCGIWGDKKGTWIGLRVLDKVTVGWLVLGKETIVYLLMPGEDWDTMQEFLENDCKLLFKQNCGCGWLWWGVRLTLLLVVVVCGSADKAVIGTLAIIGLDLNLLVGGGVGSCGLMKVSEKKKI